VPRRQAPDSPELVYAVRRAMKLARVEADQSMDEFAASLTKILGVQIKRQRVNEWESGDRTPRGTVLLAAALVINQPLDTLFEAKLWDARLSQLEEDAEPTP
jgi:transcriptional regulator with XRE-family HTH domain